jgi:hypothetical protein
MRLTGAIMAGRMLPTTEARVTPRREIECVSPLYFPDVTCLCRISKNGLVAECYSCGVVMHGGVHLCEVAVATFHAG